MAVKINSNFFLGIYVSLFLNSLLCKKQNHSEKYTLRHIPHTQSRGGSNFAHLVNRAYYKYVLECTLQFQHYSSVHTTHYVRCQVRIRTTCVGAPLN